LPVWNRSAARFAMTSTDQEVVSAAVGAAIRRARKNASLTVMELARRSGLSQPHLSQLENGRAAPSIAALYSLAGALGIGADELLPRLDYEQIQLSRRGEGPLQPASDGESAAMSRLLSGAPGRIIEAHEQYVLPGQSLGDWLEHGGEDFVYVVEGRLRVEFGSGRSEQLDAGDAIWYSAHQRHRWRPVDDGAIRILLINGHEGGQSPA
jgi:transcriptional regulator with XRE-family HTH domain